MHEADKDHVVADAVMNEEHQTFSDNEVRKFREFSQRSDIYEILIDSLAPSIWENNDVKKGILT
jgi:DNA replication licensing factor MCM4